MDASSIFLELHFLFFFPLYFTFFLYSFSFLFSLSFLPPFRLVAAVLVEMLSGMSGII